MLERSWWLLDQMVHLWSCITQCNTERSQQNCLSTVWHSICNRENQYEPEMTVQWSVKSTTWFETMCSQTKMMFPHSTLGWGKKVCHHSALHNVVCHIHTVRTVAMETISQVTVTRLIGFIDCFENKISNYQLHCRKKTTTLCGCNTKRTG